MISKREYINGTEVKVDLSKRYWFADISHYYPSGFLDDINNTCDTLEELMSLVKSDADNSFHTQILWDNREYKELYGEGEGE